MKIVLQLAAIATLSIMNTAFAQSIAFPNSSFEDGSTSWSTVDDVMLTTTGVRIVIFSNVSTNFQDDAPQAAGSSKNPSTVAINFFFSYNLAGVPTQSLANVGGSSYEESALHRNFTAIAGDHS